MTVTERILTRPGYRLLAVVLLIAAAQTCDHREQTTPVVHAYEHYVDRTERVAMYFAAKGSPAPAQMAQAVTQTKRPKLSAAQAVVESDGNPRARGRAGEKGAWQVIEKYHGNAGITPVEQALKNEKLMDELLESYDLDTAVRKYNGGPGALNKPVTKKYLAKVRREIFEVMKYTTI